MKKGHASWQVRENLLDSLLRTPFGLIVKLPIFSLGRCVAEVRSGSSLEFRSDDAKGPRW